MEKEKHEETPVPTSSVSGSVPRSEDISGPESGPDTSLPGPIPDGGREAWLVVMGSMVTLFHTWGVINSFGVFQTYYETELLRDSSPSDISWIGSLQAALLMTGGLLSGAMFDAGHFRALLVAGNALVVAGLLLTSACTRYWQVVLAQGVCVGLGCAAMFLPCAAVISQWFARRRALALGIQSAGAPVAGMVLPVIFGRLQPRIGFAWTTRVIAFLLLALSAVPIVFMRTRVPPAAAGGARRGFLDRTAFTDAAFLVFAASGFCVFIGLYVPFYYVQLYGLDYGIVTPDFSPYLVTILNAGSVVGRIVPNYLADYFGPIQVLIAAMIVSSALAFSWIGIANLPGLIVFCVLYGMASGGVVATNTSAIVPFCPDMGRLGTRMGMCISLSGLSALIGTPIAGAILGGGGDAAWRNTRAFSGATLLAAGILLSISLFLRQIQVRKMTT